MVSLDGIRWWDWVGVIGFAIGCVAFLMAVQPFIQVFWGAPKIEFEFVRHSVGDLSRLDVFVYNREVKSRILKFFRVERVDL